ncbi:MAG: acyl-CoA thioesterase [Pirellulales bacterium]|nr:acyl-CoA thioesterase [Pirellulales bacterium]
MSEPTVDGDTPENRPPSLPEVVHREHEIEIRVRYQETDAMGVVHHANYFTYFEMGRTELLRANGLAYRAVEEAGLLMVVVRINARFHRPARYDDVLRLCTRTSRVSAAKIEHEYRIFRGAELLAEGASTLACVDREGSIQRVPEWLRTE